MEIEYDDLGGIYQDILGSIYYKDVNGVYQWCNDHAAKMVGLSLPSEIIGKTDFDFFEKKTAEKFRRNDLFVMETSSSSIVEEEVLNPDGRLLIQLSSKKPVLNKEGKVIGVIGNTVDISKIKKAESDLKMALEKAELLVKTHKTIFENMKHNLITAISDIKVSLQPVIEEDLSIEEAKEFVGDALTGTDSLHRHLSDILDLVLSGEGIPPVVSMPVNLIEIANNAKDMFLPGITNKKINFKINYDGVPELVRSDKYRIERIMICLLSNAIKFSKEGGDLFFSVKVVDETENYYSISIVVKDTGMGMSESEVSQMYEPFFRGTPAYQTKVKNTGNGVGLTIVKQYIEEIDGQIDCASRLGEGTTFLVGIKVKKSILPKNVLDDESII